MGSNTTRISEMIVWIVGVGDNVLKWYAYLAAAHNGNFEGNDINERFGGPASCNSHC